MPLKYREVVLENISNTQNADYFIAYQNIFQEYDNQKFFKKLSNQRRCIMQCNDIPYHDDNYYMLMKEIDDES